MSDLQLREGSGPLVMSFPHIGTDLPDDVEARLSAAGRALADTDWHVDRLYDFAEDLGATTLRARWSRYVVDLNRDPGGTVLYPGRPTSELCPTATFDGDPIYEPGREPDTQEIDRRVAEYWQPYHDALGRALEVTVERHGYALLLDLHSIRSVIPRLFEGTLPILNFGTVNGRSCGPDLRNITAAIGKTAGRFDYVLDGRFRGGWITRRYGRPAERVFAIQIELAQRAYGDEGPMLTFRDDLAAELRPVLQRGVVDLNTVARRLYGKRGRP